MTKRNDSLFKYIPHSNTVLLGEASPRAELHNSDTCVHKTCTKQRTSMHCMLTPAAAFQTTCLDYLTQGDRTELETTTHSVVTLFLMGFFCESLCRLRWWSLSSTKPQCMHILYNGTSWNDLFRTSIPRGGPAGLRGMNALMHALIPVLLCTAFL